MPRHSTRIEKEALLDVEVPFVIWLAAQVNRDDKIGGLAKRSLAASPLDPEAREALNLAIAEWGSRPRR